MFAIGTICMLHGIMESWVVSIEAVWQGPHG